MYEDIQQATLFSNNLEKITDQNNGANLYNPNCNVYVNVISNEERFYFVKLKKF